VNILLIQLKRIGDLILTTPAIAALREKFPDAQLTLVVSRESAEILPAIVGVDKTLIVRRGLHDLGGFVAVSREKFDYCIDFTRNDRSALLALLSGARKRVVSYRIKRRALIRRHFYNEFVQHRMRDMHVIDYNLSLLRPLGIRDGVPTVCLDLPREARKKTDALRRKAKIDNRFAIFHPGSARTEKFWQPERWAEVIDHARFNWQIDCVITGGTWEFEQDHIREIKSELRQPFVDLSGKTDLLALAGLLAQAQLLVTVDSAPMHLATAMRTPQVILFGPTNPFHWRPRDSAALILQGTSTSPVTEFVSKQARQPMKQISTRAVIDAMESLLSAPAAQPSL